MDADLSEIFFKHFFFFEWLKNFLNPFIYYSIFLLINGMKNDPVSIKINRNIYNLYFPSIDVEVLLPNQLINTLYDCEVCLIITILWTNLKLVRLIKPSQSPEAWSGNAKNRLSTNFKARNSAFSMDFNRSRWLYLIQKAHAVFLNHQAAI